MTPERARLKRQMAAERRRRERSSVASCQKVFDGPHTCVECDEEFYAREFIEDGVSPVCCSCKRTLKKEGRS